jgi:hypothetical protein
MPDFIAVAGRDAGIAGYARKEDVLGIGDAPFPVFGDDLRTVVDQTVPGATCVARAAARRAGGHRADPPSDAPRGGPSRISAG